MTLVGMIDEVRKHFPCSKLQSLNHLPTVVRLSSNRTGRDRLQTGFSSILQQSEENQIGRAIKKTLMMPNRLCKEIRKRENKS